LEIVKEIKIEGSGPCEDPILLEILFQIVQSLHVSLPESFYLIQDL